MPKYSSPPSKGNDEDNKDAHSRHVSAGAHQSPPPTPGKTDTAEPSLTYFEIPPTLSHRNVGPNASSYVSHLNEINKRHSISRDHESPNKSSPAKNIYSSPGESHHDATDKLRSRDESFFERLKQIPLGPASIREEPGIDLMLVDEEPSAQNGGFSFYGPNDSALNIQVHKNGPVNNKSTIGFTEESELPKGRKAKQLLKKEDSLNGRSLPTPPSAPPAPVVASTAPPPPPAPISTEHHTPKGGKPFSPRVALGENPMRQNSQNSAPTPLTPPHGGKTSPETRDTDSPSLSVDSATQAQAAVRKENYNKSLRHSVKSFTSAPSDYDLNESEKIGAIRSSDYTHRIELSKAKSTRRGGRTVLSSRSEDSADYQKYRGNAKALHSLERTSTHLTHLGTKVKLSQSKFFSGLYDYCIVFPYFEDTQSPDAKYVIHAMIAAGLEVFPYLSIQQDELIVLFRAKLDTLKDIADKSDFKMELDPEVLEETLKKGNPAMRIAPLDIRHDPLITPVHPYEHIFLKFQRENDISLYLTPQGRKDPFSRSIRLKLIYFLITAPKRFGGHDMHINNMIHDGTVLSIFPLHDMKKCTELLAECMNPWLMPWEFPYDKIKEYFGEKIALYNVFMGHYSYWLIGPAVVGIIFQIIVVATMDFSHPVLSFYSVLCTTWAILMLEFWKREEHRTAMRWGMIDFVARESDRPEFKGQTHTRSHIDGKELLYFPPRELKQRILLSTMIIFAFIVLVIGVIASIYIIRYTLARNIGTYAFIVSSFLNVLQITLFNVIYQMIAIALTNQENHRTDSMYEDALITKIFTFQFINSYASCFFLAFIAAHLPSSPGSEGQGECGYENCMRPLALNLAVILIARIMAKNLMDIFIPYVKCIMKVRRETHGIEANRELTPAELDYMLMEYNTTVDSIRIYADSAVTYGFMLLFVTALPVATLFSLLNNYLKLKFHAWKILTLYQRPIPSGAENIRSWQAVFNVISVIAVATNAGLVCFTMDLLNSYSLTARLWIFIGYQWILLSLQYFSTVLVDDEPDEVRIQKARMACIQEKVIDKYEDEDFEHTILYDSDDDEESGKGKSGRYRTKKLLRRNHSSAEVPSQRTLTRHSTKMNSMRMGDSQHSDLELAKFCTCCCSNSAYSSSKATHKKIYGLTLPDVQILQYPTTDEASVDAPRTIVEDKDFNMLALDF